MTSSPGNACDDAPTSFQHFAAWLDTPLGSYVAAEEAGWFERTAADLFGYKALQLELPVIDCLKSNRMPWRALAGRSPGCQIACTPEQLPFANQTLDLIALPHVLDFCADPHQVLREAERVLLPEGRLLITGFNPWSLWGLKRLHRRTELPWQGHFLALPRLKDWLALLGLETRRGEFVCYRPPIQRNGWLEKTRFLEDAGDRWWPAAGGVYCLEVVKRVVGMRIIEPQWRRVPAATPASAAVVEKMRLQASKDRCKGL
ncbi:class I SAM-dependent methyltransferase [Chitiniphilus eburneus]|uniref:Class I SAM-dependent methyltransferase n=1 Tax=Chitiniphilus eburneus TaxID=2571148 RepID=A0A4U0PXN8_9NEIS|nr:class I SAM-dependent methyltransferase [Chitiniphilus eburneus]TJZ73319.1 class I SAM-dependent methyltransferase [Chitiniphilus eburneus]